MLWYLTTRTLLNDSQIMDFSRTMLSSIMASQRCLEVDEVRGGGHWGWGGGCGQGLEWCAYLLNLFWPTNWHLEVKRVYGWLNPLHEQPGVVGGAESKLNGWVCTCSTSIQ